MGGGGEPVVAEGGRCRSTKAERLRTQALLVLRGIGRDAIARRLGRTVWDPTVTARRRGGRTPRTRGRGLTKTPRGGRGRADASPPTSMRARSGAPVFPTPAGSLPVVRALPAARASRASTLVEAAFRDNLWAPTDSLKSGLIFTTLGAVRREPRLGFQPVRTAPPRRRAPTKATPPLPFAMEVRDAGYPGWVFDLATPLQQCLKAVESMATLGTLEKLTRNSAQAPAEEKFRKVRAFKPRLVRSPATPPTRRRLRHPARPPFAPASRSCRFLRSETNGTVSPAGSTGHMTSHPHAAVSIRAGPIDEREDRRAHHRRARREGGDVEMGWVEDGEFLILPRARA